MSVATYNVQVADAGQDKIFQYFAADPARTDNQHTRRRETRLRLFTKHSTLRRIPRLGHGRRSGSGHRSGATMLGRCGVRSAAEHMVGFSASLYRSAPRTLPEHEYQVRMGAAIQHLRKTLPVFMDVGLVDRNEQPPRHTDALSSYLGEKSLLHQVHPQRIYHKKIHFRFYPPLGEAKDKVPEVSVPAFALHGRRSYLMSAQVLRWSLQSLFLHTEVRLEQLALLPTRGSALEAEPQAGVIPANELAARIRFSGTSRLSGALHTYTLRFRYRFDRRTGMICEHTVDQLTTVPHQPAPPDAVQSKLA